MAIVTIESMHMPIARRILDNYRRAVVSVLVCLAHAVGVRAAEDDIAFFESNVRPILVNHCYACHSRVQGKSKGGLELDSRETILQGGDRGPAMAHGAPT